MIMALEYITNRELEGKTKGSIRILKMQEDSEAMVEYKCPNCGFSEKRKEAWSEPFVMGTGSKKTFNLQCGKCNFKIKVLKLKKEIKKK